ncbi:TetR/AcrR family transcriptional regulator [Phenylobacterium aquaticum]|uniref:TetR/AcrR family transcriptional regulator n=1 Tax=Phenylobacterium aquaticum TaxID=1763816 RepID=UPI0026EEE577|nr:TetR/AcrR family transcriptional regulator [Phenylobacterium aquaticum]
MSEPDQHAPQQARSRLTMERLLSAALAVLEDRGLAGITIPEIAAEAGLSTGSIYRRFADKDALIKAAFLQLLDSAQATNQANLPPDLFQGRGLADALRILSRALVAQYAGRTGLLKALDQYLETQTDAAFRGHALDRIEANMRRLIAALLPFRDQIAAKDPERAITFALLAATTVIEVHKLHTPLLWRRMLPLDDEALAAEVARTMAAYLGA